VNIAKEDLEESQPRLIKAEDTLKAIEKERRNSRNRDDKRELDMDIVDHMTDNLAFARSSARYDKTSLEQSQRLLAYIENIIANLRRKQKTLLSKVPIDSIQAVDSTTRSSTNDTTQKEINPNI
jgi:hypothetical protein